MSEESVVYRRVMPGYELIITCPSDLLEESVVYQDIFQKGEQRGIEQGARKLVMLLLELRFGKPSLKVQRQIERLAAEQLEALCVALLYFQTKDDLTRWLKQHALAR
jgi:predicted transposase YdaD